MTDLQLRIQIGDDTFVYTDLDMGEGTVEAGRAYLDGEVEADDVSLTIDAASFCGWTSLLEIPDVRVRAELRDTVQDTVILDGTIHRTGIVTTDAGDGDAPGEGLRRWSVRLLDTALDDVLQALGAVALRATVGAVQALGAGVGWADVKTIVRRGAAPTPTTLRWWSARELLAAAIAQAGATVTVPDLFDGTVRYLDAQGDEQRVELPDRGFVAFVGPLEEGQTTNDPASTIPDVSGRDWWTTLSGLLGLTLAARYEPWPSAGPVAVVTRDRWAEPDAAGLVAVGDWALAGWDVECSPAERPDLEIRFANDLDETSLGEGEPLALASRFATARAVYTAGVEATGEAATRDAVGLRQVRVTGVQESPGEGFAIRYGTPYLDAEVDEPYLAYLQGASFGVALVCYDVDEPPVDVPTCLSPVWANVLYAGHAMTGSDVLRTQVEVDLDDMDVLAATGAAARPELLATQYALEGAGWRTEQITTDADRRTAALTLARPALGYAAVAAPVQAGPPSLHAFVSYWVVEDQAGGVADDGYEAVAVARTGTGLSRPDRIEVEYSQDGGVSWTPGSHVDLGSAASDVEFRARSVYASIGYVSDWVHATAEAI